MVSPKLHIGRMITNLSVVFAFVWLATSNMALERRVRILGRNVSDAIELASNAQSDGQSANSLAGRLQSDVEEASSAIRSVKAKLNM